MGKIKNALFDLTLSVENVEWKTETVRKDIEDIFTNDSGFLEEEIEQSFDRIRKYKGLAPDNKALDLLLKEGPDKLEQALNLINEVTEMAKTSLDDETLSMFAAWERN